MLYKHFLSNQVKAIEKQREWASLDAFLLSRHKAKTCFEEILISRRTQRVKSEIKVTEAFISKLLKFCVGVTGETDDGYRLFSYPSPGATYASTVFISVDDWKERYIYRYNPYKHALEYFKKDVNNHTSEIVYDRSLKEFPVKIFLASDYQLIEEKYGEMAYRLLCLEMGHMAQNISLYSSDSGFNAVCIGGYNEPLFKEVISREYDLHYVIVVG